MPITVIKTPQAYSPTGNPILYTVKSTRSTIVYFDAVLTEFTTGAVIATTKYYVRPDYPSGVNIDISAMLDSYAQGEFKPYKSGFVHYFSKQLIRYNLKITEKYISGSSIVSGEIQNFTDTAMRGKLDTITRHNFVRNHYFVGRVPKAYFMTTKPDKVLVNDQSEEGLYFLQDNTVIGLQVVYEFYSKTGWLLGSYGHFMLSDMDTYNLWRINCSPAYLKANITGIDFSNLGHYTVRLADPAFFSRSETKTFIYEPLNCGLTPVNIYWENKFCCIDTYQFINPEMSQTVNRTTVKKNPYRMNEAGEYADYSKQSTFSVFNVIEQVLDASAETTIKVWTKSMTDIEAKWMSTIFLSKNYWIKADGELYIPLLLQDTSWNMQERKYMDEPNVKQLNFKFRDEYSADYKITVVPSGPPPKPGPGTFDPGTPAKPPVIDGGGFTPSTG